MNILRPQDEIKLDHVSAQWLGMLGQAVEKSKLTMVPKKYFDVLKVWGLVEGTPGAAKITSKGYIESVRLKADGDKEVKSKKPGKKRK